MEDEHDAKRWGCERGEAGDAAGEQPTLRQIRREEEVEGVCISVEERRAA